MEIGNKIHLRQVTLGLALISVALRGIAAQQPPAAPPPPAFTFTSVDLELLERSNELDQSIEQRGLVYSDADLTEYVSALGNDLLPPDPAPEHVVWKFHVLRDSIPNAFALPNGSLYVNSGLLALLENEAQLASVLAHEETHVLNRHGYLENRSNRKKSVAINVLGGVGPVGLVASAIVESTIYGHSRELEKEADIHAVAAVNAANYSTEEMINAFKLLETSHEVDLSHAFYQDHPKLQDRIEYVGEIIHETAPHTRHPMVEEERYVAATEKVSRDNVTLDIRVGRERTAVATAQRLVKQNPKSAEDYRALGDAWRALGPRTPDPTPEELSSRGKKDARKMETKLTDQEYDNALMATPAGKAALETSQKQSEDAYKKALELDPADAASHRGMGFLYEKEHLPAQSAAEFRKYLELAPDAIDQLQIHRRLEIEEKEAAGAPATPKP